jgi:hypothetical protein
MSVIKNVKTAHLRFKPIYKYYGGNQMACFAAPLAEAIVVSVAKKVIEKKEKTTSVVSNASTSTQPSSESFSGEKLPFAKKLGWLENLLWGGSALLAFEHIWHGEVVPFFPFLTAASNPESLSEMIREIATTGVCMSILVTGVWALMVAASVFLEKRYLKKTNLKIAL